MVVEIPKAQTRASGTGSMPMPFARLMIAGIRMVVRTVLLVKIRWLNTVMKIRITATIAGFILSSPMAYTRWLMAQVAAPVSSTAFPTA